MSGNFNKNNAANFKQAINQHVNDPGTHSIIGTYRDSQDVTHFFNPSTGVNVMNDANGNFLSGWKLSDTQIDMVLNEGRLW